jgi:membrane associated rhomboid family serine protease
MDESGQMRYVQVQPAVGRLFTPAVAALIGLSVAGFLVLALFPGLAGPAVRTFGLSLSGALGGLRLWQFVTHTMICPTATNAGPLVGTLLFLFFFGGRIEREWGTARFVAFYAAMAACTGLVSALAVAGTGGVVLGGLGVACGLLGAYAVLFRGEAVWLFFARVRVEYLVLGFLAILLLLNLRPPENALPLTGAGFGYAYARLALLWEARRKPRPAARGERFSRIDLDD